MINLKKMKYVYPLIFFGCFLFSNSYAISDIKIEKEFPLSISSPWGITHDGSNFWVSGSKSNCIYKLDANFMVLDSIVIPNANFKGIEYYNNTLWVLNSTPVGDTTIWETTQTKYFHIYSINIEKKSVVDTVDILAYSATHEGVMWGLCIKKDTAYVSFDGGYGVCNYKKHINSDEQELLCCSNLVGMCVVNDSIWGICDGGNLIANINETKEFFIEQFRYKLDFKGNGIVYNGEHFWILDMERKIVLKSEKIDFSTTINNATFSYDPTPIVYPTVCSKTLNVKVSNFYYQIIDLNAYSVLNGYSDNGQVDVSSLHSGLFFIRISKNKGQNNIKVAKFYKQ